MDCGKVKELLLDISYGAPESAATEVSAHLRNCEACRAYAERLERGWNALDLLQAVPAPDMAAKVLARVRSEKKRRWTTVLLPVAAMLLLALGIIYIANKDAASPVARFTERVAGIVTGQPEVNEDDIIRNLPILKDKEFFDSMDEMRRLEYLPLMDERPAGGRQQGQYMAGESA